MHCWGGLYKTLTKVTRLWNGKQKFKFNIFSYKISFTREFLLFSNSLTKFFFEAMFWSSRAWRCLMQFGPSKNQPVHFKLTIIVHQPIKSQHNFIHFIFCGGTVSKKTNACERNSQLFVMVIGNFDEIISKGLCPFRLSPSGVRSSGSSG